MHQTFTIKKGQCVQSHEGLPMSISSHSKSVLKQFWHLPFLAQEILNQKIYLPRFKEFYIIHLVVYIPQARTFTHTHTHKQSCSLVFLEFRNAKTTEIWNTTGQSR